jgi:rhodanese-related sulfurtransferase
MSRRIDRDEVQGLLDSGGQLVDVLPTDEYEEERIPGAVSLPLKELNRESAQSLDRARPVIVYCYDYQ